jgi:hypothetical protein
MPRRRSTLRSASSPLGHHLAAAADRHLHDAAHELLLERLLRDAVDEMAVDLDEVGPHLHPAAQRGETLAQVVQRDAKAVLAQGLQGAVELGHVGDGAGLGQLHHHAGGGQAQGVQRLDQGAHPLARGEQGVGGDVEEELARQAQGLEALHRAAHDQPLQLDQPAQPGGGLEQHQRRVQRAVGRAAGEGLEAEEVGPGDVHQRLEMDVEALGGDQAVERQGEGVVRDRGCAFAHGRAPAGERVRDIRTPCRPRFLKALMTKP